MVNDRARNIHPKGGKPLANLQTLQARNKSPLSLYLAEALLVLLRQFPHFICQKNCGLSLNTAEEFEDVEIDVVVEDERVDNDVDAGAEVVAEHEVKPGAEVAQDSDGECCGTDIEDLADDDSQEAVDERTELDNAN